MTWGKEYEHDWGTCRMCDTRRPKVALDEERRCLDLEWCYVRRYEQKRFGKVEASP